ncbi:MAG: PPC domain-containing protein [Planctomycetota bacterium]|nr:PPC domain-containing protein [Planctomycetota bacterium]
MRACRITRRTEDAATMIFERNQAGFSRRVIPLFLLLILLSGPLLAKPPKIRSILPLAAAPGKSIELVITGDNLETVTGLWTTFDSKTSIVAGEKRDAKTLRIRVEIPKETPLGIGAIRARGPGGLSNPRLFAIDDLATRPAAGENSTASSALTIEPPCAIDSQTKTNQVRYYSFKASAGQGLSFEVLSQRIGSSLDPVLRILDSAQKELAYSNDSAGADSRISWRAEKDGSYLLELRDVTWRGGEGFNYRLRAGDFPLVSAPYPLRAEQGTTAKISVAGIYSAGIKPREVQLPNGSNGRAFSLTVRQPGSNSSNFVTLLSSDLPELLEKEPNNQAGSATRLGYPGAINGRFSSKGDRDYYSIEGKKGERVLIRGETQRSGSPTDLFLRLEKPGGEKIADAEDQSYDPGQDKQKGKNYYFDEGSIDHTFAADGPVILMVEDLTGRGGPEHVYRIEVRPTRGRFALELAETSYQAPRGGSFKVKVHCRRDGYKGPVELEAAGLPAGAKAGKARIDQGKTSAELLISLDKGLEPGTVGTFRIFTTIEIGGKSQRLEAGTREALRKSFPRIFHPPRILDGLAAFAVSEAKK